MYDLGEHLLMVATDRVSAFDVVLDRPIPGKGIVLSALSAFWFERLAGVAPNHYVTDDPDRWPEPACRHADILHGRALLVRACRRIDAECVVRGYLAGAGWAEYRRHGTVAGAPLPPGLLEGSRLPEPRFTPSTKAEQGHDEPITVAELGNLVGPDLARTLEAKSLALYERAHDYALARGIIIADTKFEFGLLDGEVVQIDESLTPDSSRFWPADAWEPGRAPPSLDKQPIRDWLDATGWDRTPPAPALPDEVVTATSERYREAFRRLAG
ncbi:MAG: phosphoribosylaminoimidazolesuccinocarboxamide synthase [Chloroflexota bacterium]|nr:phosphoribosylaminoimidazolesuccinocarboxamide synthase [Chloroflexota bacterium]